jgi:predicted nucleotidyltransferase
MKDAEITPKEITIKEIGSYFQTDSEGYLVNPASVEKIGDEWRPVVNDIIDTYKTHYGEKLHSVYVRGSVAKGDANPDVSDVDTFAYVTLPKDQIKTEWIKSFEGELAEKYPFVQGFEISVDPVESAQDDRILLLQSACVFGEDLSKTMPKVKVGKETLGHVYSFKKNLIWFDEWAKKSQEKVEMMNSCTWLMKRFLRTGLELTMERAGRYTRDLYPSYKVFAEYYPEKEAEMKEVLYLALNPTDDLEVIKKIRNNFGVWLEEQTSVYKK